MFFCLPSTGQKKSPNAHYSGELIQRSRHIRLHIVYIFW